MYVLAFSDLAACSMIIRASRPRLPLDVPRALQPAFEQIQLPWLCPALLGARPRQSNRPTTTASKRRPILIQPPSTTHGREPATVHSKPQERGFAYATNHITTSDDYIPFEYYGLPNPSQPSPPKLWSSGSSISDLPDFDPTSPLVIHDSMRQTPRRFRESNGIGGEVSEIQQTLEACVQVGRLERAAATVKRFNNIYKLDAPELIKIHNNFLASMIERVVKSKDQKLLKDIQRWFEVEIRAQGILPNATTYGLMLRAAFQESNQVKIDRTLRRYLSLAEQAYLRDETLASSLSILNLQEFGRVTSVSSSLSSQILACQDQVLT